MLLPSVASRTLRMVLRDGSASPLAISGCDEVVDDSVVSWKRHGGPCQHIP